MNGNAPTLISGVPNVAASEATIRSHASAIPSAPASTCPRAAQIVGLPSAPISLNSPTKLLAAEVLVHQRNISGKPAEVGAGGEHLLVRGRQHHAARPPARRARARTPRSARPAARPRARCAWRFVQRDRGHAVGHVVEDGLAGTSAIGSAPTARFDCSAVGLLGHARHRNRPAWRAQLAWPPSQEADGEPEELFPDDPLGQLRRRRTRSGRCARSARSGRRAAPASGPRTSSDRRSRTSSTSWAA